MTAPYIAARSHPLRSPSTPKSRITPRGWTWIVATVLCAAFWGGAAVLLVRCSA